MIMAEKIPVGIMSPEAERYFGVLLERLEGKFDHMIEFLPVLDKDIAGLTVRMDRLESRMENLEVEMIAMKIEFKEIRKELKTCTQKGEFLRLEKRVTRIEQTFIP